MNQHIKPFRTSEGLISTFVQIKFCPTLLVSFKITRENKTNNVWRVLKSCVFWDMTHVIQWMSNDVSEEHITSMPKGSKISLGRNRHVGEILTIFLNFTCNLVGSYRFFGGITNSVFRNEKFLLLSWDTLLPWTRKGYDFPKLLPDYKGSVGF
jgi:hypothetical protein